MCGECDEYQVPWQGGNGGIGCWDSELSVSGVSMIWFLFFIQCIWVMSILHLTKRSYHIIHIICIPTHVYSRSGWGYCQLLNPEWEELASKVKGFVKIAYWDTEKNSGPAPFVLGEIRGTPTIKLLRPKRKAKTNKQKDVVDYNMERKAADSKYCTWLFVLCVGA